MIPNMGFKNVQVLTTLQFGAGDFIWDTLTCLSIDWGICGVPKNQ